MTTFNVIIQGLNRTSVQVVKRASLSVAVWNLIWTKFMESNTNSVINNDEKKFMFVKIVDIQQTMLGLNDSTLLDILTPNMTQSSSPTFIPQILLL